MYAAWYSQSLDLHSVSFKGAYGLPFLPALGSSDHNCVHVILMYHPALERGWVLIRLSKSGLRVWDMFKQSRIGGIDKLVDVVVLG